MCSALKGAGERDVDDGNGLMEDEYGLKIPKFHPNIEKVKSQLVYHGPEIPGELWRSPERPVGYFGKRRLDPSYQFAPARRAIVIRARRRKYMATIYRHVRRTYKRYIKDSRTIGELLYWRYKLDALPKNSAPTKYHNFCPVSGRFRAYYSLFGLGRHPLRDFVNMGYVPGVRQANW
ncbi:hypothetical protein MACJ_001708 [Theileria orientalis]|uniref:30S ribosomal protein S14 n=1 Tax=Theileria orientalis TaxID=68886 RepID=A0A976QRR1_THEOR|nr:hypothetical protein MACJ_001708 [Theileria orientalis]